MGTRADFYVGRGAQAEWLGSIGWDGYPDGIPEPILTSTEEASFRQDIADFLKREDGTTPDQGWPWLWPDSRATDFSYVFDAGHVWISCLGHSWVLAKDRDSDVDEDDLPKAEFPNMSGR